MVVGDMFEGMTVLEVLEWRVSKYPDRVALISNPDERVTYAQLWDLSGRVYAWLKHKHVGPEDVVLFCLPRGIGLYACMIGTLRAGAAFVLCESDNESSRTEFIRGDCACKLFVGEAEFKEIERCEPRAGHEEICLHNLCYIAYTSGTTSHPKGVMHEYGALENAWKSCRMNGVPLQGEGDTFLLMSPMNFVSLENVFAFSSGFGNAVALMPYAYARSQESFEEYMEKVGVSCGYLTPSFLRRHYPFRCEWKSIIISSEPADGLYLEGVRCYNSYALTESGCLLTMYELKEAMTPAPAGKSQSDVEVFVADEEGREVPSNTVGEVCYRNPYVRGYRNLPEETKRLLRGGVVHTGDMGKTTDDGTLIVCGRLDEMIKVSGYRFEPEEVGEVVRAVTGLKNIVVRGFVYKDLSSIVVFYTDDVDIDEVAAREGALKRLPKYMAPTTYLHLKEFPLLETGKLDKLRLLPPEGSWEPFRASSVADIPLIGQGRTSSVYDLGAGKVVRLFRQDIPFQTILSDLRQTHAAHLCGIRVPDAYEIVRSGDRLGILMDKVDGTNLEEVLISEPDRRPDLICQFASEVRQLHQVRVEDPSLSDVKARCLSDAGRLDHAICSADELSSICSVFEAVDDAVTFVHGDCHTANAMLCADGMEFVDLTSCGRGHPIFDLLCMYSHYVFLPSFGGDEECRERLGMDKREAACLYEQFLRAYLEVGADADISDIEEGIAGVAAARVFVAQAMIPGAFTEEMLASAKEQALRFAERLDGGEIKLRGFLRT